MLVMCYWDFDGMLILLNDSITSQQSNLVLLNTMA